MAPTNNEEYMKGKDMFILPDGAVYHLGTKPGQVADRIICVGSEGRAAIIAKHFDKDCTVEKVASDRLMFTHTGTFKGVRVSVIAIGMGAPMMDFMLREASYCSPGPMAVVRVGSCGIYSGDEDPGCVMTAGAGSMFSYVNYAHQSGGLVNDMEAGAETEMCKEPILFCKPVKGDAGLNDLVTQELKSLGLRTSDGINACGETFYACQGRINDQFEDDNCKEIVAKNFQKAGVKFVEMETHQLFSLALRRKEVTKVASACIGIVNRHKEGKNVSPVEYKRLESEAGLAALNAIIKCQL